MQVFQRQHSVLGGIDEAIAVLKLCSGRDEDGEWQPGWDDLDGPRAARGRRDLAVRDRHAHRGRLLAVRPPRDGLPRLARAAHADHAQRPRGRRGRGRQADPLLPRPARPLAGADRRRLGRAHRRRDRRLDRRAGVLVGRQGDRHRAARADRRLGGDTVAAARAFADHFARRDEHRRAGRLRQRLGAHLARGRRGARRRGSGASGSTPRTRSSTSRCSTGWASFDPRGVNPELVRLVREALDEAGHRPRAGSSSRAASTPSGSASSSASGCRSTCTASARA